MFIYHWHTALFDVCCRVIILPVIVIGKIKKNKVMSGFTSKGFTDSLTQQQNYAEIIFCFLFTHSYSAFPSTKYKADM